MQLTDLNIKNLDDIRFTLFDIEKFQDKYSIHIPEAYQEFLLFKGSGLLADKAIQIPDPQTVSTLPEHWLGLFGDCSIESELMIFRRHIGQNMLPFCVDSSGNPFCVRMKGHSQDGVFYVSAEDDGFSEMTYKSSWICDKIEDFPTLIFPILGINSNKIEC